MSQTSSMSNQSHDEEQYKGMIKQSFIKVLRNHFFNLFSYMDSVVPNFFPMHEVITVWRIIQFIGPCICAANTNLWDPNESEGLTVSIISIFFHIIPVSYRKAASSAVEFVYCAINIVFFISIVASALYYKKAARLPTYLPSILSVYIHTFGYLIHPINLNLVGEDLGRLIDGSGLEFGYLVEILSIVLSLVCFVIWFWFFDQISVVSLLFRPNSLISVLGSTQTFVFITTNLVTFILAVASQLSKYPSGVLTMIAGLVYLAGLLSVYTPGAYISSSHKKLVWSSSIVSCVFTFILGIYILAGRKAGFIELLIYVIALIIAYILSAFVLKASLKKQMTYLDNYDNKTITIDDFKSPNQVVKYGITGLQSGHPACLNWRIFREGTERWPDNVKIWVTFAKFVAIYPQENVLLSQIVYSMSANKLKGNLAKQTISQARNVYTQRESSLSTILKGRLNRANKHVQTTKRKLRHVWDLAIQGSINEMEGSINNAYNSVNRTRSNFNHLLSLYPNNRFVARSYLHYLLEIEGDPKKSSEWAEKVGYLNRGIPINPDKTNLLGIHAFPGLPPAISDNYNQPILSESESFIGGDSENASEYNQAQQNEHDEQINVILDYIDKLRIPGPSCIKLWNIFLFFILIMLPAIIIMAIIPNYMHSLSEILYFEYYLSHLRTLAVEVPTYVSHMLLEAVGFFPPPNYNVLRGTTKGMLYFLLYSIAQYVESLNQYRHYRMNDEKVKPAHDIVFTSSLPYMAYSNQTFVTNPHLNLQGAFSDVCILSSKMMDLVEALNDTDDKEQYWALQKTTTFLNPYMNSGVLMRAITQALVTLNGFLSSNAEEVNNLAMFICILACLVYALIIIGILIYQLIQLDKCKKAIYKCLTSLPKNVVSAVSESLKLMNKSADEETEKYEEADSDLNKQDENILKIFSSSDYSSAMKSIDKIVLITASIFLLIFAVICTVVLALAFPEIADDLNNNSPHLGFIHGTASYGLSAISALDNLIQNTHCRGVIGSGFDCENPKNDKNTMYILNYTKNNILSDVSTFVTYYQNARYGRESGTVPPYSLFESAIKEADASSDGCVDEETGEWYEYFSCFPANLQLNLFKPVVLTIMNPIAEGSVTNYDPNSTLNQQLWNLITMGISVRLLYPMFGKIIPEMENNLNNILPSVRAAVIIILILAFIDILIIIFQTLSSESKMKFALSLLLHCPPTVVLQTPKIMRILSGDFSNKGKDSSGHNNEFFDSIVRSIPDCVIVCDSNYIVTSVNKASERVYGVDPSHILGNNAHDFFTTSDLFKGDTHELFQKTDATVNIEFQRKNDDNKCFLEVNVTQMGENYTILTKDITQTVLYNNLIAEERAKSDSLLSSILPPSLVRRVQDGEKNISFGVQSASILFLDVVEFTPWCASNTAAMVMSTLNTLFRKYDADLAMYPTMTKIKCIGDCYMCSGGIFVEINQPSIHAKETVEFGLDAINIIEENNKEMNLSLRIRVGVNTGGPIVAGVLGTEKPTFEILGPAINMAQQMENHGVPMKVHISRSTYELIYGGNFVIKERGQIEIKRGSVLTYIVESKK